MLSSYRVISMEHLPGQHNVWADMLSRWAHPTYYQEGNGHQLNVWAARKRKRKAEAKKKFKGRDLNEFLNMQYSPRASNYEFLNMQYSPRASNYEFLTLDVIRMAQRDEHLTDMDRAFLAKYE